MNNRRKLVLAFGASALVPSLSSIAQLQTKVWRVGFLGAGTRPTAEHPDANIDAFILGMRELGYIEGKNLSVEWQFAQGKYDRLPALALQLVQSRVEMHVTYGTAAAQALHAATSSVPIVVAASIDPVGSGIAASLAHPGGNITGLSAIAVDLSQKHLELLTGIIPKLSRVAVLINPGNSSHPVLLKNVQAAGKALNISILSTHASAPNDIEQAFAAARRDGAGAVIVAGDALFAGSGQQIATAATNNRMPAIGIYRDHVALGTLMSYGQNIAEFHRRAATYVDKIFKGAKPGDLPVEQPMTIGLFINGRTAKALGLTIPRSLLISADKVID